MSPQLKTTDASTSSRRHDAARPQQSTRVVYCEVFQSNHVAAAAARSLNRMIFPATEATPMYHKNLVSAQRESAARSRQLQAAIASLCVDRTRCSDASVVFLRPHRTVYASSTARIIFIQDNDGRFDGQR